MKKTFCVENSPREQRILAKISGFILRMGLMVGHWKDALLKSENDSIGQCLEDPRERGPKLDGLKIFSSTFFSLGISIKNCRFTRSLI